MFALPRRRKTQRVLQSGGAKHNHSSQTSRSQEPNGQYASANNLGYRTRFAERGLSGKNRSNHSLATFPFPIAAAAICATSSNSGGVAVAAANPSRSIELQNGHAAATTLAPVATNSCALSRLTRLPVSSPKNISPPPPPQQKPRSRARGGSTTFP